MHVNRPKYYQTYFDKPQNDQMSSCAMLQEEHMVLKKRKENKSNKTTKHMHEPISCDITSGKYVATNACYSGNSNSPLNKKKY